MSLDQYLPSLNKFSWNLERYKDNNDLWYDNDVLSSEDIQQFSNPLPIPSFKLYFDMEPISKTTIENVYPAGLSILQILGSIQTFYDQPITLNELRSMNPVDIDKLESDHPGSLERIRLGQLVPRKFALPYEFGGLQPYGDGYKVITYV